MEDEHYFSTLGSHQTHHPFTIGHSTPDVLVIDWADLAHSCVWSMAQIRQNSRMNLQGACRHCVVCVNFWTVLYSQCSNKCQSAKPQHSNKSSSCKNKQTNEQMKSGGSFKQSLATLFFSSLFLIHWKILQRSKCYEGDMVMVTKPNFSDGIWIRKSKNWILQFLYWCWRRRRRGHWQWRRISIAFVPLLESMISKACSDMALELGKIKTEFTLYVLILVSTFVQRRFCECFHCT